MRFKRLLLVVSAGLALGLAGCGGDDEPQAPAATATAAAGDEVAVAGASKVKVAFSAPSAGNGWQKAVTESAKDKAEELGVDMTVNDSATTAAEQAEQVETLINERPDVLIVLPLEGEPLTPVAQKAMAQGIPVINVDRELSSASAYRTVIGGDNYGIGVQAGNFFADQLSCQGNVVEIQGIPGISVTQQRSQGFADQIKKRCNDGIKIIARQPADFEPEKGHLAMEKILQSESQIDAVYTHDDDMSEGVAAAIENAGRQEEMWMTGAGGSKAVMEKIKEGGLWRATFLYNPAMAADAVYLASLLGQGKGLPGFAAADIPSRIVLAATTVTQENVDDFMSLGF
jgi:ribose transport system substrate-binding protein